MSSTMIALIAILLVGGGLRAYKVIDPNPVPGDDAHAYYALSKSLYEDGTFGGPDFTNPSDWSPGAPLLYAAMFHVTGGPREGSIRALEALLGLAAILTCFALARRIMQSMANSPRASDAAGLSAAGLVALYPPFIHSTGTTMSEPVAILLLPLTLLAILWALDRGGTWPWAPAGLAAGALAMTRPEYLAVAAVLAAVILILAREGSFRQGLSRAAVFGVCFLVPIIPWTAHNLNELGRVVPISTGSGKALFVGTFKPGDGDYQRTKAILVERQLGRSLEPGSRALDEVRPRPLFDHVASRFPHLSRDKALGKIGRQQLEDNLNDPIGYGGMLVGKVWRMWSNGQGGLMESPIARALQVALVLAGLAGLVLLALRQRWREALITGLPIGVITAVGAVTLASDRRSQILMTVIFCLSPLVVWATVRRFRTYSPRS